MFEVVKTMLVKVCWTKILRKDQVFAVKILPWHNLVSEPGSQILYDDNIDTSW